MFGYILTEERTIQPATPGHIDLESFREYLQAMGLDTHGEPQPSDVDDLRNRGVVAELGDTLHPTLYGVLAFGKEPQRYPQTGNFRIECVAHEGDDRASRVLQVADARGTLDEQVRRAAGWFSGLGRFESYRGIIREDRPLLAGQGASGSAGQCRGAPRLCDHRLENSPRNFLKACRCDQSGWAA